jgi:hypothetical protein
VLFLKVFDQQSQEIGHAAFGAVALMVSQPLRAQFVYKTFRYNKLTKFVSVCTINVHYV